MSDHVDALLRSQEHGPALPPQGQDEDQNLGEGMGDEGFDGTLSDDAEDDLRALLSMRADYGSGTQSQAFDDIAELNNPDIQELNDPPVIGDRKGQSDMWGASAETIGRTSSPKLFAQASNFPTAVQYRVWRWENGVPCAIGAIDVEASEDDFIRMFLNSMPEEGDGRFQYRLRPVDIRGSEIGKEFTINISENHNTLVRLRDRKRRKQAEEREAFGIHNGGGGNGNPIIVNPGGGGDAGASYAEEMGRMFEHAVETAERRTEILQETLEDERERLRAEEKARTEERMNMAARSADVVQQMTERLMAADRSRATEQLAGQKEQANMLMSTLTTVFQQQQEAARQQAERLREADMSRLTMDREFFERQRQQQELTRDRERQDYEQRQSQERNRLEMEAKRMQEQRNFELEQLRIEGQRREGENERKRQQEKEELALRLERERMEMERQRQQMAEERERWRAELEEKRRGESQEWERKRQMEREEAERRRQIERDDGERKEREYRERMDRERMEWQQRLEQQKAEIESRRLSEERRAREEREAWERRMQLEKQDNERREQVRREELQREADRRREETLMQVKQMEMQAQRDREHQEKMMEMGRLEREAQRDAQLSREKAEAEQRALSEAERQRQHTLTLKEMDLSKERDREHQERMMQMSKIQQGGGFGQLGETLGMETPELLSRIFGGGGEGGGSWSEAIPKVLGSIAEVGKAALTARAPQMQVEGRRKQRKGGQSGQMVRVQTPQGPQLIPIEVARQHGLLEQPALTGNQMPDTPDLLARRARAAAMAAGDTGPSIEELMAQDLAQQADANQPAVETAEPAPQSPYDMGVEVDTMARAKMTGMKLLQQKKGRKGIKKLIDRLNTAEESEWDDIVMGAIIENLDIYHYIQAVSYYAAMAEGGSGPELADKVAVKLRGHELVPEDIHYTEDDWLAGQNTEEARS